MLREDIKNLTINFGPQHPAAHGVLRLIVETSGETVKRCDPHIGLLHRGTEKLMEYKTYLQSIPYFDRLDYVSMMSQEHTYVLAIESLLNITVSKKASYIRVLFLEMTRILNHLLAITTHALDIGAITPFLWGFELREKIMEFYERVSGARMHSNYIRPGGVMVDCDIYILAEIYKFVNHELFFHLEKIANVLNSSRIWKQRLINIGSLTLKNAENWALTGPLLRSCGTFWDLRKVIGYEVYSKIEFSIPFGFSGDSYDRYLIRLSEMLESGKIITSCLNFLNFISDSDGYENNLWSVDNKLKTLPREFFKYGMEELIAHFKLYSESFSINFNENYYATETPKGELGVFLASDDSNKPFRSHIRSSGFFHLQSLNMMSKDHMLADLVTLVGTQDLVFGEIDR